MTEKTASSNSFHRKQLMFMSLQTKNNPFQCKFSYCLSGTLIVATINCKTIFSFHSQSLLNNSNANKNKNTLYIHFGYLTEGILTRFCKKMSAFKNPTAVFCSSFSSLL